MTLALLFDLDGTMVDTDALHIAAWNAVLAPLGRQIDADFYKARIMGFDAAATGAALFPNADLAAHLAYCETKEAAFRGLVTQLEPTPGLPELLDWADRLGLPKAVVTNAPRANAVLMLRGLGLVDRFPVLVIGEELAHGKPHPLPYLTGLQHLGATAARAVAFEDSLSGMRAAVAAGLESVGIATALAPAALHAAGARLVVKDFTDPVLLARLRALAG